ncbi:MAG TPA: hypothetical protein VF508_05390, partial [Pyrinomonadaceae bacterium]
GADGVEHMELEDIRRVVEGLDEAIPKEGARVGLHRYGEDLDEAFVVANERGYLRLGVEFLKAGFAPHAPPEKSLGERPHMIYVDLDYLLTEDSDLHFDYFERNEEMTVKAQEDSWVDKLIPAVISVVIVSILVLAIFGLVAVVRALR